MPNLVTLITDHRTEMPFVSELYRLHSKPCSKNPVQRGRRAAALQVSQDAAARFFVGSSGDLTRHQIADASQPVLASFNIPLHRLAILRFRSFGDDNQRSVLAASVTVVDCHRNLV